MLLTIKEINRARTLTTRSVIQFVCSFIKKSILYEPRCKKTGLRDFRFLGLSRLKMRAVRDSNIFIVVLFYMYITHALE